MEEMYLRKTAQVKVKIGNEKHIADIEYYKSAEETTEFSEFPHRPFILKISLQGKTYEERELVCLLAFNALRCRLEPECKFLCQGSCPNIVQSAMMSQTASDHAYKVGPDLKLRGPEDAVYIFDPAEEAEIGTVQQQKDFIKRFNEHWFS